MSFYMQSLVFIKLILSNGDIVFTETMYSQPGIRYFISALSDKLSALNCYQIKLKRAGEKVDPVSADMNNRTLHLGYLPVFIGLIIGSLRVLDFTIKLINKKTNDFNLVFGAVDLTKEFKDVMDIHLGVNWKIRPKVKAIKRAAIEIGYASFITMLLRVLKKRIRWVVTGDSAYRYGFITESAQVYGIQVVTNIDLNSIFMNVYSKRTVRNLKGRQITKHDCAMASTLYPDWNSEIDDYFKMRFSGKIVQHDVLNAYKQKNNFEYENNTREKDGRIVVTLFAHVFCDAPRNVPGTLFGDFYNWFINSVIALSSNPNVLLYIREHPSAYLYNEQDLVSKILDKEGLSGQVTLWRNESTDQVLKYTDVVVTCSGTVGLEAAYLEKPVVIASHCCYSQLGICHEFEKRDSYLHFLRSIDKSISLPTSYTKENSALVAFVYFKLFENRDLYPDFPLPPFVRGVDFGKEGDAFYREIGQYVSGNTIFSNDLADFLIGDDSRYLPKLNHLKPN